MQIHGHTTKQTGDNARALFSCCSTSRRYVWTRLLRRHCCGALPSQLGSGLRLAAFMRLVCDPDLAGSTSLGSALR
jgi:hypothetical protein